MQHPDRIGHVTRVVRNAITTCSTALIAFSLEAASVGAQGATTQHAGHASNATVQSPALSAVAEQQLRTVGAAIAPLADTSRARRDGFEPMFGWIPFMGTHWVKGTRMIAGRNDKIAEPSQLMFSRVNGRDSLVGVAYAYFAATGDTTHPTLFDGDPLWHDHPDLAPPGTNLVMLHAWLVPSPDGPFAGYNPFLPFWAAGATPPDVNRMSNDTVSVRVRKAALALAEIVDTAGMFPVIARRAPVHALLEEHRAAVRGLLPSLEATRSKGDQREWDAIADKLGSHWDAMREAYLKSAVNPTVNAGMVKSLNELLARSHGAHH